MLNFAPSSESDGVYFYRQKKMTMKTTTTTDNRERNNTSAMVTITSEPPKIRRDYPWFTTDTQGKRVTPKNVFHTCVKFFPSRQTERLTGFLFNIPGTGQYRGVREDDPCPKLVCLLDPEVEPEVQEGVLYRCMCVFKHNRRTAVCIDARPYVFHARVSLEYVKDAVYQVNVIYGNRRMTYDPKDGGTPESRDRDRFLRWIRSNSRIKDRDGVAKEFEREADRLGRLMKADGYL